MAQIFTTLVPPFVATKINLPTVTTGVAKIRTGTVGALALNNTAHVNDDNQVDAGWFTVGYEEITPNILGLTGNIPAMWFYHKNADQAIYAYVWIP